MSNAPIKTPEPTVDPECPETDWNPARRIVRRLKGQRRVPSHLTLADLRETAEVTQAEMAKRLGTHQTEISRLERRPLDRVSIGILRRYAAALGARVEVKNRVWQDGSEHDLRACGPVGRATVRR